MSKSTFTPPHSNVAALATSAPSEIETLNYMRQRLFQLLHTATILDHQAQFLTEPQGRQHRVIVFDRDGLLHSGALTFVGFFGIRRHSADFSILSAVDGELVDELYYSPHMLSYSSLELSNGEWVNFVLMRGPEGLSHWASSARHSHAARTLAPSYYTNVCLHIGVLPYGLDPVHPLRIDRTRQLAFGHIAS